MSLSENYLKRNFYRRKILSLKINKKKKKIKNNEESGNVYVAFFFLVYIYVYYFLDSRFNYQSNF